MSNHSANVRWTILFTGTVQGVGFRYHAQSLARHHPDLAGYVRNLADGDVELVAEAPPASLARFLAELEEDMAGYIRDRRRTESAANSEFAGFTIRR